MKQLILIIVCLPWVVCLWANPVTVDQARQKASQFLQSQVARKARRAAPAAQQLKMAAKGRDDTYYIFNAGDNGGYVVVSGDDATEEILGYSNTGTINPDSIPCSMKWLFENYTEQIKYIRENGVTREEIERSRIKSTDNGLPESFQIDGRRLTKFDQHEPYNDKCPIDQSAFFKRSATGCVATAMAGLMYAYKWPKATTNKIPSYEPLFAYVNGSPKGTVIDWDNIIDQYAYRDKNYDDYKTIDNIEPVKKEAIATLMRLAGTSVKTWYEADESSSNIEYVPHALTEYFGYDNCIRCLSRKNRISTWINDLKEELYYRGPVLYRGVSKDGKNDHAFLLEGWEGDMFYINNGHSGFDNFLCYLNAIDIPYSQTGSITGTSEDQKAILYVRPLRVELEVTGLRFDNVNRSRPSFNEASVRRIPEILTFTETNLRGSITFHNKGENKSWKFFFLQLRDVEKADTTFRVISKSLLPDESYTYNFSFSDLTIGHHYVLSSLDLFGDEFYQSAELLCVEDTLYSENDNDIGNENLVSYEYWFDDDFDHREIVSLSNNKAVIRASLETDQLTIGVHRLNFRVKRDDGNYSAITSSLFLKRPSAQSSQMEYWFDDNFEQRDCMSINNTEEEQAFALDLCDDTKYPMGFHQLNMRITLKGGNESAVCSSGVFKLSTGYVSKLEYWFDGDINHSNTISCQSANNMSGFIFADDLNLTGILPGHHRLYYRAISDDGLISSAVSSTPVMVNINYENAGVATMSSYSLIIDNDSVASSGPMDATKEVELNYTLDTENLQEGTHTLQATFWNSYGLCVMDLTSFEVVPKGFILGDVNGDGNVNITDAVCILNYILGNPSFDFIFKAADINNDTIINITDVVGVVNLILNNNSVNK